MPGTSVEVVSAVAEGVALGAYAVSKAGTTSTDAVGSVALVGPADAASRKAVKRAAALGEAVAYTRDLVNLPPNLLYPETFVDSLADRVKGTKVKLKSYDMKALRAGGFGGTVGVGQGSANDPRIAVLSYAPARAKASIAFVGKGITFDSGGLCIKPANGMLTMKCDMAGAAAVAGAVLAIAELGLPIAVTGYLGLAENMPSSTAQRPSDVVTMRGGKTVEVLNTDAEGRMVLGDCIALASETKPDAIVDIATLTGAQVVALANTGAVMGNDDAFRTRVLEAAATVGEAMWPMPLPQELRPALESINADLAHKGGVEGGMLTAGIFLSEFVGEGIPWSHLDIAGPAFNDKAPTGYWPKGGTGLRRAHPASGSPSPTSEAFQLVYARRGHVPARNVASAAYWGSGALSRRTCGGTSAGPWRGRAPRAPWSGRGRRRRPCHRARASCRGRPGTWPSSPRSDRWMRHPASTFENLLCAVAPDPARTEHLSPCQRTGARSTLFPLHPTGKRADEAVCRVATSPCGRVTRSGVPLPAALAPLTHPVRVAGLVDVVDGNAELVADLEPVLGRGHRAARPLAVPGDEHDRRRRDAGGGLDVGLDPETGLDERPQVLLDRLAVDLHLRPVGTAGTRVALAAAAS